MNTRRAITTLLLIIAGLITGQLVRVPGQTATIAVQAPDPTESDGRVTVTRVVDGDTIEIDTGQKVRYIGVNTPETVDPHRGPQCYGHEASAYNTSLVLGHRISLVKDVSDKDAFGRLLRYVYLEDGTQVNLRLVAQGYAYAIAYKPDTGHQAALDQAQRQAQEAGLGVWSACPTQLKHD